MLGVQLIKLFEFLDENNINFTGHKICISLSCQEVHESFNLKES